MGIVFLLSMQYRYAHNNCGCVLMGEDGGNIVLWNGILPHNYVAS